MLKKKRPSPTESQAQILLFMPHSRNLISKMKIILKFLKKNKMKTNSVYVCVYVCGAKQASKHNVYVCPFQGIIFFSLNKNEFLLHQIIRNKKKKKNRRRTFK